ncbi:unnamed protein product [Mycena citricolor]|uniref:Grap2 and cyclin-D-interacting-domain-containing protein n=1 Tax=Mycena citricolor TaxID=2018698 RepID=A0AAD2HM60_9AGAR|nr:unnamed protein product [Mycena citricolor]
MSTPQQAAIVVLHLIVETCNTALDPQSSSDEATNSEPHAVDVLRKDLTSIASLLYSAVTKVSLALKPSKPTYSAAIAPLKDLSLRIPAFFIAVEVLSQDVFHSLRAFVQIFLDIESSGERQSTGQAGDEYMVRTAAAHTILDKAQGLSQNNAIAVKKRWVEDAGSLNDGIAEVAAMIEDANSPDGGDDDGIFDDGWAELGLDSGQAMSAEELECTKKVHMILRLMQTLHKRVLRDIILAPATTTKQSDQFSSLSHTLPSTFDELISTLYVPQTRSIVKDELAAFRKTVDNWKSCVDSQMITSELEKINLDSSTPSPSKWFDNCFTQLYKAIDIMDSTLD